MSKQVKTPVSKYAAIIAAVRAATNADGKVVELIVEARQAADFNGDDCAADNKADLVARFKRGEITQGTMSVTSSRVKKLATCKYAMLMEAAAVSSGLTSVYTYILEAEKIAKGGKPNASGKKAKPAPEDKAANHDTYVAPATFTEYMVALRGMDAKANAINLSAADAVMLKETIAEAMAILNRYTK